MKKLLSVIAIAIAFAACTKVATDRVEADNTIDPSRLIFNITVNRADAPATKAIKSGWDDGDIVYVFFENNTTNYLKMVYDAAANKWDHLDKNDGTDFTGLSLSASGKKLTAVYLPAVVEEYSESNPPLVDINADGKFEFRTSHLTGFYMTAEAESYTVKTTSDPATLEAELDMKAPEGLVQFCVPKDFAYGYNALCVTGVQPVYIESVTPGGSVTLDDSGLAGHLLQLDTYTAASFGEDKYCWGILQSDYRGKSKNYEFMLVTIHQRYTIDDKIYFYARASKTKAAKGLTLYQTADGAVTNGAVKLSTTGWSDWGNFVDMGYPGGPKWATGNLTNLYPDSKIAYPGQIGIYYMTGYKNDISKTYAQTEQAYSLANDPAYNLNNKWKLPTREQLDHLLNDLFYNDNAYLTYKRVSSDVLNETYTDNGVLITSKVYGYSLFFPFAGYAYYLKDSGFDKFVQNGTAGYYLTSTNSGDNNLTVQLSAYGTEFRFQFLPTIHQTNVLAEIDDTGQSHGYSARPVLIED